MRFSSLAALLMAGCVAGGIGEQQAGIVGGSNDSADPAVVLIIIGDPNGGYIYMCTGEVISPHVVLTAAHCTTDRGPYNVYLGSDINRMRPSDLYSATAYRHPEYRNSVFKFDVGVLVLDKPVTVTPLPFNKSADVSTMIGQPMRLVGYGSSGSLDPNDTSAGIKRSVMSALSAVTAEFLEFDDVHHNTCEGDSGGPALVTLNGVETIVGLTSFGQNQSLSYCDGEGFNTRTDTYADFVQPFIDMHDPPPAPLPGQPGATGSGCNSDDECYSKNCTGPNGYCTTGCDPNQAAACPEGLTCTSLGPDYFQCMRSSSGRASGCSVGGTPEAPWLLLPLLLFFLRRRRFSN